MRAQDLFKIIKHNEDEYIIILGKHLATEQRFATPEEAQAFIDCKDYDLMWALIAAFVEATGLEKLIDKKFKEVEKEPKEEEDKE